MHFTLKIGRHAMKRGRFIGTVLSKEENGPKSTETGYKLAARHWPLGSHANFWDGRGAVGGSLIIERKTGHPRDHRDGLLHSRWTANSMLYLWEQGKRHGGMGRMDCPALNLSIATLFSLLCLSQVWLVQSWQVAILLQPPPKVYYTHCL